MMSCCRRTALDFPSLAVMMCCALIAGCSGGDASESSTAPLASAPALKARLVASGTYVECGLPLDADVAVVSSTAEPQRIRMHCPGGLVVENNWKLGRWRVLPTDGDTANTKALAEASTLLPTPMVIGAGDHWNVLARDPGGIIDGALATLEAVDAEGRTTRLLSNVTPAGVVMLPRNTPGAQASNTRWRWSITRGTDVFVSEAVLAWTTKDQDLGFWGALAVGRMSGDERDAFLGTNLADGLIVTLGDAAAVDLAPLHAPGRDFRDVRLADLDGDGLDDVISNVYGQGCTMIGIRRREGGHDWHEPRRADGSCIGGHGETILVADFDHDGMLDIVLPSYERFDYLRNLGDGRFVEEAQLRNILLPNYLPQVEGAAAVDIDLDGAVDIIVASEILMNDGRGRFTRMPTPYGPTGFFDEGLSVVDLDRDGRYDIVKHHPDFGPRLFWGQATSRVAFADGGFVYGGVSAVLSRSYGVATGMFTGGVLPDLLLSGGDLVGAVPRLCVQPQPRHFHCMSDAFAPSFSGHQDLLLVSDVSGDGVPELVARGGTLHVISSFSAPRIVYRFDLRDAQGRRNLHGTSVEARCAVDGSLVEMRFVDGGNGYMAQSSYVVSVGSDWCPLIELRVATRTGLRSLGAFAPGLHRVAL